MNPSIFARFQTKLGPESVAVWWATPQELNLKSDYLSELDYFFDGLITKSLRSSNTKSLENLFLVHHNFGKPFYLIYSNETKAPAYIKQALNLVRPETEQKWIHPLAINTTILKPTKNEIEKVGLKIAPLIDGMSS